jgi:hypothetical protein
MAALLGVEKRKNIRLGLQKTRKDWKSHRLSQWLRVCLGLVSAAPTALRPPGLIPSPSGLGLRLADGPFDRLRAGSPGLASMAIFAVSFLAQLAHASRLLPRQAPRHAGTGGAAWRTSRGTRPWPNGRPRAVRVPSVPHIGHSPLMDSRPVPREMLYDDSMLV